jgi:hypothetical protein
MIFDSSNKRFLYLFKLNSPNWGNFIIVLIRNVYLFQRNITEVLTGYFLAVKINNHRFFTSSKPAANGNK